MERIVPESQPQWLVRAGEPPSACNAVCELGIYSVFLGSNFERPQHTTPSLSSTPCNEYAGWLLRVKPESADEGGVSSGFAWLGAPIVESY